MSIFNIDIDGDNDKDIVDDLIILDIMEKEDEEDEE